MFLLGASAAGSHPRSTSSTMTRRFATANAPAPMADVSRGTTTPAFSTRRVPPVPSKGVLHTHNSIIAFGESTNWMFDYGPTDVAHNCLPLFHANALCVSLLPSAACRSNRRRSDKRFSASGYWNEIREQGATVISILGCDGSDSVGTPTATDRGRQQFGPGSPIRTQRRSAEIYDQFEKRFGLRLVSQYGMTDTSSIIGTPPWLQGRPGYAGVANPNFECIIADENDEELPDGVAGELLVRPRKPHLIMSCYWNNPQATMETWRNLWFHSGDVLIRDPDGWFRFVDRQKDAMRRFGENISSFEVESVIAMHPAVQEVAVYAVPSELSEDEVMAAVVFRPEAAGDFVDLGSFCDQHLPYFASPRYLVAVDALPKTLNEKVRKEELRRVGITSTTTDRGPRGRKKSAQA